MFRDIEMNYFGYVREKNEQMKKIEYDLLDIALNFASDISSKEEYHNSHSLSNDFERYKVEAELKPVKTQDEKSLPNTIVMCFFEEVIEKYRNNKKCIQVPINIRDLTFDVYVTNINGNNIGFTQALIGSSGSAILMEEIIARGAKNILACGGAGVLENEEKALYVPVIGLKNDGVSPNLSYGNFLETDKSIANVINKYFDDKPINAIPCATWTTDASRRETRDTIDSRILDIHRRIYPEKMPILVEMEFTALLATARKNKINFGQILYGGDKLFKGKEYDENNWTKDNVREVLFETVLDLASNFELDLEQCKQSGR